MATSEVFRPANGPLLVNDSTKPGLMAAPPPMFPTQRPVSKGRPSTQGSRPGTQGSQARFGNLSHSSFFARHNPHPGRVRHIKGLLDIPICAVHDDGYFANPRYALQFPPNNHDEAKMQNFSKYYKIPVGAINVNSQQHPINTITGLQYFMGKPMNMRIFREKAINGNGADKVFDTDEENLEDIFNLPELEKPKFRGSNLNEAWKDELKALTDAIGLPPIPKEKPATANKPRTAQYSSETGRLIPPPSRAMSRQASRASRREKMFNKMESLGMQNPEEFEEFVLRMLCQILQTDDERAAQSWLLSAPDKEKELVLNMIQAVIQSNEEYNKQHPDGGEPAPFFVEQGKVIGDEKADRLTLDGGSPPPRPPTVPSAGASAFDPIQEDEEEITRPYLPDVFRPESGARPSSQALKPRPLSQKGLNYASPPPEPRLKYTVTPLQEEKANTGFLETNQLWEPGKSTV